ncbi:tautomerase family protein [Sphingomonas sp. AP4-R1]|uniref:tautomerase family protein n=1 Tax=Sphingomonas sp. AP4-R1 TaxID=2735134 RepID=UPI0014937BEB|nr:tautomerase family protein [Sphingomonas sp. AP4-R1]QJU57363.1 tautomerase family protein [Sphingomonas sp. AP4-R1]
MPSTVITTRQGWIENAEGFLDAVHSALVETIGVKPDDRTLRLIQLPPYALPLPPRRGERYVLVEISLLPTRTVEEKQALYAALRRNLEAFGTAAGDVKTILHEVAAENWG